MEVGQAVLTLDLVDAEFDLAEGVVFVFLEVGERDFDDAAFKGVIGVFETGRAVYERLADTWGSISTCCFIPNSIGKIASYSRMLNVDGALMLNQSFLWNGSIFFFRPFLPFDNLLFFPTAMMAVDGKIGDWWCWRRCRLYER